MITKFKPFLVLLLSILFAVLISFALKNDSRGEFSAGNNKSDGKPVCGTVEHMELVIKNDNVYKKNLDQIEKYVDDYIKKNKITTDNVVITIPTVVHVVWNQNSPQQNISYQQILTQIKVLNEDFRRKNRDTVNTPPPFKPLGADIQVEFCLAKRDPSNNPSIGVTRTSTTVTEFGIDDQMKFNGTGGHDAWDRDKYLNIWVCNLGNSLLGYAEFPGGPASTDGVVIHYRYFGTIGTSSPPYNLGRTATHEIGHWLYLYHIWGDDNGSCAGSDQVDDTPNQALEFYGCPVYPRLDACSPSVPGVMFMNYMDYTDDGCMNIFTQGQSTRMNGVMSGFRLPLQSSDGCTPVSGVPIAMFGSDSTSIEYGNAVHFSDNSAGIPTSWLWSFPGGSPSTSNVQNPTVVYNTPGLYTVSLRITNSYGSDSITVVNYLRVRGAAMNIFALLSPPSLTRIQVSSNDPALEFFKWQRSSSNPAVTYKFKIKKIGVTTEYVYVSSNSGMDTLIGLRRSFLDSLAAVMGTTGDSVRCTWRVYAYNGLDSLQSSSPFLVTLVRNVIGIQQISTEIPDRFALFDNYPNPFNPVTNIKFQIPVLSDVKLIVYDITGREADVLVNKQLTPGTYKVDWDASNVSSGIYFYRIVADSYGEAGLFTDSKKMAVIK